MSDHDDDLQELPGPAMAFAQVLLMIIVAGSILYGLFWILRFIWSLI